MFVASNIMWAVHFNGVRKNGQSGVADIADARSRQAFTKNMHTVEFSKNPPLQRFPMRFAATPSATKRAAPGMHLEKSLSALNKAASGTPRARRLRTGG